MMASPMNIYSDKLFRIEERVVVAVVPIDAFTALPITSGVKATIEGSLHKARKSFSGKLVFVKRLSVDVPYPEEPFKIHLDASEAGYFDEVIVFPSSGNADHAKRMAVQPLLRLPSAEPASDATHVAGVVVRGEEPVEAATITGTPPGLPALTPVLGPTFQARSDKRGAFVLPLRLPPLQPKTTTVPVVFSFSQGDDRVELLRDLKEGKFHSFEKPVDLTSSAAGPPLRFGSR